MLCSTGVPLGCLVQNGVNLCLKPSECQASQFSQEGEKKKSSSVLVALCFELDFFHSSHCRGSYVAWGL